jgi:hypothetical protein
MQSAFSSYPLPSHTFFLLSPSSFIYPHGVRIAKFTTDVFLCNIGVCLLYAPPFTNAIAHPPESIKKYFINFTTVRDGAHPAHPASRKNVAEARMNGAENFPEGVQVWIGKGTLHASRVNNQPHFFIYHFDSRIYIRKYVLTKMPANFN